MLLSNQNEKNLISKMLLFILLNYDLKITSVIELIMLLSVSPDSKYFEYKKGTIDRFYKEIESLKMLSEDLTAEIKYEYNHRSLTQKDKHFR